MCCCCPQAVTALFCLWVRSGFSKETIAGALAFFPPSPALYKFIRVSKDGDTISDEVDDDDVSDDDVSDEEKNSAIDKIGENNDDNKSNEDQDATTPIRTGKKPKTNRKKKKRVSEPDDLDNDKDSVNDDADPAKAFTEQAMRLRKLAKVRNARDAQDHAAGCTYTFVMDPRLSSPPRFSGTIEAIKIGPDPKTKNFVAALLYRIRPEHQTSSTKTIIYSHGNATDIGAMNFMQSILAKGLQANVLMYDYSGYGASGGVPLESNTYRDIKIVYKWVTENVVHEKNEKQIVVYGQSVGSGPSCYICSKRENVGGLVLHSPFMSGMRVLTSSRLLACLDIFPNIQRIKKVSCPVMIIHGALDEEVDISHGQALHNAVPESLRREPWWVPDRSHNDITEGRAKMVEYIERLRRFLTSLDQN